MKKLLLTSAIALFTVSAHATDIKPILGLDTIYSDIGLTDGYDMLQDKYASINMSVGSKFGKYIGIEGFAQYAFEQENDWGIKTSFYSFGVDTIGYLPVYDKVNLLGSLGLGYYDVAAERASIEISEGGLGVRLGAGIQYDLTDNVALRSMARYVKLNNFDSVDDMIEVTAGIRFSF